MEREKTGAELLLSEPEIVAWLGLTDEHAASARRTESRVRGRTALAWHGARRSGGGRPLPTARAHGLGIAL